ncbi:MAG: roadblock/LC7 domain-containing protein [Thermodesulfobacteriota bacterium]
MPFSAILRRLTERSGASGAVLVDRDGEVVASHPQPPPAPPAGSEGLDMPLVGAHHAIVIERIREASSRALPGAGPVKGTLISTTGASVVISTVKEGLCLVVLTGGGAAGKVLFESGRAVRLIEEEMG